MDNFYTKDLFIDNLMKVLSPMLDKLLAPLTNLDILPCNTEMSYKSLEPIKTDDIPISIEPILTLNQEFEKNRRYSLISSVYPFSVLTVGAIYKIISTKYYKHNSMDTYKDKIGIINIVKAGDEECTMFRVWAPSSLLRDLDLFYSTAIVHIRPTGLHTDINTKNQYYTYELSIGDL